MLSKHRSSARERSLDALPMDISMLVLWGLLVIAAMGILWMGRYDK